MTQATAKDTAATAATNPLTALVEHWAPPAVREFYSRIPASNIHVLYLLGVGLFIGFFMTALDPDLSRFVKSFLVGTVVGAAIACVAGLIADAHRNTALYRVKGGFDFAVFMGRGISPAFWFGMAGFAVAWTIAAVLANIYHVHGTGPAIVGLCSCIGSAAGMLLANRERKPREEAAQ